MSCNVDPKLLENHYNKEGEDIILYHSEMPVIKVQCGTTFGLTKMLYESTGGVGRIIGLKPRKNSDGLVCIITQDLTILTEQEYDIILYGGKETEYTAETESLSRHDKCVNTIITVRPTFECDDKASFMNATSNTLQSLTRCSEKNTGNQGNFNFISVREPHAAINHESNVNVRSVCQSKNAPMVNLKTNQADVQSIDQKWCGVNGTVAYDQNEEEYVICNPPNSHDSNSTGGVVSDTDSRSSEGSVKFSPSQVYQAPVYQRKSGDELSEIGNAHQGGGGDCSENLMREISETKREYKKWQCLYCMKSFLCRSALENHERTHTGEKPFQCTDCGRCFSHQGNLKQHLHIHRDVKPHICDICGKGFTRSNRLRDHKLAHEVSSDKNIEWTPVTLHTSSSWPLRTSEPNGYTTNSKTTIYKDFQKSSPPRE